MTDTRRTAYILFAQTVLLLLLYAAVNLLGAVKFLMDDPLALSLPYSQVGAFAHVLLNLAIQTGLLGGGIYVIANAHLIHTFAYPRLLRYTLGLWMVLLILAFFAGILGLLDGRAGLELPPVLVILQVVALALFITNAARSVDVWSAIPLVWTMGMALSAVCTLIGLIPTNDYVLDRLQRVLAVNLNLNVAYVLAALALGYWLIHRFSNAPLSWAESGLYSVAGLLTLAGVLVCASALQTVGGSDFITLLGNIAVFAVPLAYLIFAAHSYYALSNRNPTYTLAAHWYGLAVLLFLLGTGLLGALQAPAGIHQWTAGTRLTDLQATLTAFAIMAVVLGVINQASAEMRGENGRITGLLPFWLVAFGSVGGGLALGAAGVVQVYLERILSVGYLDTQTLLIPLYVFWILGALAVALGVLVYALGFWSRRLTS